MSAEPIRNTVCPTCGGFRKINKPRLYQIQVDENLKTGMTMGEWSTCSQCDGNGHLPGLQPPV